MKPHLVQRPSRSIPRGKVSASARVATSRQLWTGISCCSWKIESPRAPQAGQTAAESTGMPGSSGSGVSRVTGEVQPAQPVVERPFRLQLPNPFKAQEARRLELLERQLVPDVRLVQLLDSAPYGPFGPERRNERRQLVAIDPVRAKVGLASRRIAYARSRHDVLDDLRDLRDPVVLCRCSDVERLIVDDLPRRVEHCEKRIADVAHVHEWTPRRSVALDQYVCRRDCVADEAVDDKIRSKPGGEAIGRGVGQIRREEGVVGQRRDLLLCEHLRAAVGRDRVERCVLVEEVLVPLAVETARRREEEARHTGLLRFRGQADGSEVVHVVRRLRAEVAHRVVRDRRQVEDRVEAAEISRRDVADVHPQRLDLCNALVQGAPLVEIRVQADDLMARRLQHRDEHGADVAVVAGDEDPHLHHRIIGACFPTTTHAARRRGGDSLTPVVREETAVPFIDLRPANLPLRDELLADIAGLLERGNFVHGPEIAAFEAAFAGFCGTDHCVGTSSGLDALRLGLIAGGIEPGDEVIVPANTFVATFEAVVQAGGAPVAVDVSETDYNLDPTLVQHALTARTRFLLPVHLYGQLADMGAFLRIADEHGLRIVEDACQAHGAERDGHRAGRTGAAAAFSFYPTKNLGAAGDAGALVTSSAEIAETARALREHGEVEKYRSAYPGYTARLDSIQAMVLSRKLPLLEAWNASRADVADFYDATLEGVGDVRLPPRDRK